MRDENSKKSKIADLVLFCPLILLEKLSWSKTLVRKWFNIKSKPQDFHADDDLAGEGGSNCFYAHSSCSHAYSSSCLVLSSHVVSRVRNFYSTNLDRGYYISS
ncbi:hypothetical protein BHE74_00036714 [Ensete ventricosum]|uniref:Uncharacterized protein n=1 Tax=Ensete ventricosum TaxID=4639 RepID=A0A426YSY4_ENSVE|nr:hypothetical protein B296_00025191 [Ensete ventricosum]RWW31950.1 hypothetical protein GW17_00003405 [Ensete ventricosum]RWW56559.1 hypothetical protein BHE74_00036714 [Ensete ventricosum]RZS04509.1 hypothetical protein BHM03_00034855 [Ensete ventricosum]